MKRKKILLLKTYRPANNQHITPPIGLLSLKSYIESRSESYDILCIDMVASMEKPQDILKKIKTISPDLIGFSVFTYEYPIMKEILQLIQQEDIGPVTVMGGPHSTVEPEKTMQNTPGLDYIIIGEGEETFLKLLNYIFGKEGSLTEIDGIAYRSDNDIKINPKLKYIQNYNSLPIPSWNSIDLDVYNNHIFRNMNWIKLRKYAPILTSRACPYECIYCHNVFGKGFRPLAPERVLEEMVYLHEKFHVGEFHILDDVFNLDRDRAAKIMKYIIDGKYNFRIAFPNGLRGDILDHELLMLFRKAGVYRIVYAVESASERVQKLIRKNINLERLKNVIEISHNIGFFQHGFFMIGFPTETLQEIDLTIDFALKSRLHTASFFQVVPFPSTRLYSIAKREKPDFDYDPESLMYYSKSSFYSKAYGIDLNPKQKAAYKDFYLNIRRLYYIVRRIPSYKFLLQGGVYFMKYSFGLFRSFKNLAYEK